MIMRALAATKEALDAAYLEGFECGMSLGLTAMVAMAALGCAVVIIADVIRERKQKKKQAAESACK